MSIDADIREQMEWYEEEIRQLNVEVEIHKAEARAYKDLLWRIGGKSLKPTPFFRPESEMES